MLEDKQWLQEFMNQKTTLMLKNYGIVTAFLHNHGVRFYKP